MKPRMRSSVSVVMRPPLRRRLASLPSFTARRPKVDSARPLWRQNSEISCRMASFMVASLGGSFVGGALRQANQVDTFRSTTKGPTRRCGTVLWASRDCARTHGHIAIRAAHGSCRWIWVLAHQLPSVWAEVGSMWTRPARNCRRNGRRIAHFAMSDLSARTRRVDIFRVAREPCRRTAPLIPLASAAHSCKITPFSRKARDIPCRVSRPISATCSSSIR